MSSGRVIIEYHLPLNEMVMDFYDRLKTLSKGYASMEYEVLGYQGVGFGETGCFDQRGPCRRTFGDCSSKPSRESWASLGEKAQGVDPRQYQVAIQAAIGSKIIARETLGALRKDVTAKCYGGDITPEAKALREAKEGKKRMKSLGKIEDIPQEGLFGDS